MQGGRGGKGDYAGATKEAEAVFHSFLLRRASGRRGEGKERKTRQFCLSSGTHLILGDLQKRREGGGRMPGQAISPSSPPVRRPSAHNMTRGEGGGGRGEKRSKTATISNFTSSMEGMKKGKARAVSPDHPARKKKKGKERGAEQANCSIHSSAAFYFERRHAVQAQMKLRQHRKGGEGRVNYTFSGTTGGPPYRRRTPSSRKKKGERRVRGEITSYPRLGGRILKGKKKGGNIGIIFLPYSRGRRHVPCGRGGEKKEGKRGGKGRVRASASFLDLVRMEAVGKKGEGEGRGSRPLPFSLLAVPGNRRGWRERGKGERKEKKQGRLCAYGFTPSRRPRRREWRTASASSTRRSGGRSPIRSGGKGKRKVGNGGLRHSARFSTEKRRAARAQGGKRKEKGANGRRLFRPAFSPWGARTYNRNKEERESHGRSKPSCPFSSRTPSGSNKRGEKRERKNWPATLGNSNYTRRKPQTWSDPRRRKGKEREEKVGAPPVARRKPDRETNRKRKERDAGGKPKRRGVPGVAFLYIP